ncbi:MAG: hypothetical protein KIS85_02270 [Anaerolineales bacterium]|nr:hypothetical protein [Anaerolineales bacterium]
MTDADRIIESLRSHRLVDGLTHNLYSYPARFSPELTKEIIANFSEPGDWIFDPYMGGGTSVVQALAMGRNALGVDINALAHFVATNKISRLSSNELLEVENWIKGIRIIGAIDYPSLENPELGRLFPRRFLKLIDSALYGASSLKTKKARKLAKFILLKAYHGLLSDSERFPNASEAKNKISIEFERTKLGLERFEAAFAEIAKTINFQPIAKLLNRNVIGLEGDRRISKLVGLPKLVFTSPPYPGVHVLYNKWQIASRKETDLPYYISNTKNSFSPSFYTLGGRSKSGIDTYFDLITDCFVSVAKVVDKAALVVQLVGFSNAEAQLPRYLKSMELAGYGEVFPLTTHGKRLWRNVPNRKWYSAGRNWDSSREVLLFHQLADDQISAESLLLR